MTEWQKAWGFVTKNSKRKNKAWTRRQNHRANRRAGKALSDRWIKLDKLQVN
jgi:hypothetical protein